MNLTPSRQAWAVGILLLVCYVPTLPSTIPWGDSGELATACYRLGIAHPTGYPLYTMAGFVWSRLLPIGDPGWRLNLLSAVCAAAGGAVLYLALRNLLARLALGLPADQAWAAGLASLAVGLSPIYWSQAAITEVYALLALLLALGLYLFLRSIEDGRWFWTIAVWTTAVVHHRMALAFVPGLVLLFRLLPPRWVRAGDWTRLVRELAGGLALGLLPILYLPLRAAMAPMPNWGDPASGERLWAHLAGTAYAGSLQPSLDLRLLGAWALLDLVSTFSWILFLIVAGFVAIGIRHRTALAGCLLLWLVPHWLAWSYRVGDWWVFLLPGHLALGLPLAAGMALVLRAATRPDQPRLRPLVLVIVCLAPVTGFWLGFPEQMHLRRATATAYARAVLEAVPEDGVLLTGLWYPHADNEFGSVLYAKHALGLRPDVDLVATNFLRYEWYARQVRPLGISWRAEGLTTDVAFFSQLEQGVVRPLIDRRPVCTTQNFAALHGRPWRGGPVTVPPALRHGYRAEEILSVTNDLSLVAEPLWPYIPSGKLYRLEKAES